MKKRVENKGPVARSLFGPMSTKEEPTVDLAKVEPVKTGSEVKGESNIDGYISKYIPDAGTDRFVLITPEGKEYACKFYNRVTNDFVGASMLSMYNLRDHFDRTIIPLEEDK